MATEIPANVGPYDILGVIGKGGMGVVYKGFQHSLNRLVAIKILLPEFQSDPERVERFHREAQAIAILSHPNIVQIIDKGAEGKTLYFVMEFVDGVSLDTLLRERRLTFVESLHVAKEIAKGLAAAHASGIIHRDLKPRNVLVSRDLSMVKLVDFGISRVEVLSQAAGSLTSAHTSFGTMYYFSPEQARDPSSVDQRSDLYSLGVIAYEMLTGQVPVGQFQLPSEVNPELNSQVDALLLKCLATDRAKRYPSTKEFLADIDKLEKAAGIKLLDELKQVSQTTSRIIHTGSSKRAMYGMIAAGALILALVAGYFAWPRIVRPAAETPPATATTPSAPAPVTPAPSPAPAQPATPEMPPSGAAPQETAPVASQAPGAATSPAAAATPSGPVTPPPSVPAESKAKAAPPRVEAKAKSAPPASAPAAPPVTPADPPAASNTAAEIEELRQLVAARRFDEAGPALRAFVSKYPKDSRALDAQMLLADLEEKQGRASEAIAAYLQVGRLYQQDPRAAGALYRAAQLMLQARGRELEARNTLGDLVSRYPTGLWTVGALTLKASVEERLKLRERDSVLVATVPASLMTYRTLVEKYPTHAAAQPALIKLADMYDDMRRYDLAARAFADLGTNFPTNQFDAWFKAGELYERRVNDRAAALKAYQQVPQSSDNFREAQRRAARLMQ
jgi:serine/threonine protein kinase/tetratricopeptide (TPR) repeat protein